MLVSLKIKLTIAAVAVAVTISAGYYIKALRADNARLAHMADMVILENVGLKQELAANLDALLIKEAELAVAVAETNETKKRIDEVEANDKDAFDWGCLLVPGGYLDSVCP